MTNNHLFLSEKNLIYFLQKKFLDFSDKNFLIVYRTNKKNTSFLLKSKIDEKGDEGLYLVLKNGSKILLKTDLLINLDFKEKVDNFLIESKKIILKIIYESIEYKDFLKAKKAIDFAVKKLKVLNVKKENLEDLTFIKNKLHYYFKNGIKDEKWFWKFMKDIL